MNFDLNMLSTLMQLMGKQPGGEQRQSDIPASSTTRSGRQSTATSFVLENGIGEKVRITADSAPSPQASSPIAGILEMMGGKMGGTDGMSALMPMLMGILGKGDRSAANDGKNADKNSPNIDAVDEDRVKCSHKSFDGGYDDAAHDSRGMYDDTLHGACHKNDVRRDPGSRDENHDMHQKSKYSPISYAGYALISALNLLCRHVYG